MSVDEVSYLHFPARVECRRVSYLHCPAWKGKKIPQHYDTGM